VLVHAAVILLVLALRFCDLEHVDISASVLKLVTFSFSAKGRESVKPRARPPANRRHKPDKTAA
jgi:hypothetical protein